MSEITRLIVVRHGNTFNSGDVILRVGSATDIPLTETGMKQGYAAGAMLAELGFEPGICGFKQIKDNLFLKRSK